MLTDEEWELFKNGAVVYDDHSERTCNFHSMDSVGMHGAIHGAIPYSHFWYITEERTFLSPIDHFKANWSLLDVKSKPQGIYHLAMLEEFLKEARINPEPWNKFQVRLFSDSAWVLMKNYHCIEIFNNNDFEIRLIPKTKKVYIYVLRNKNGTYFCTDYHDSTSILKYYPDLQIIYRVMESMKEVDDV